MAAQLLGSMQEFYAAGVKVLPMVLKSGEGVTGSTSISALTDSMVSGLEEVATEILKGIGSLLPTILMVVGAIMVVKFGISFFKKMGASS